MTIRLIFAGGLIGFAALACAADPGGLPTQPATVVAQPQPPPEPPPPAQPGVRLIELGSIVRGQLTRSAVPAGCPATTYPNFLMPCRRFEVVAPSDGTLRVELDWVPQPGAEAAALIVADVDVPHTNYYLNPQIRTHRIVAGVTYEITVVYWPSHYDYVFLGPDLIGEFELEATFEQ